MTISNFGSKILSFLLVPIYTSVLTTAEYGTYDLYTVTVYLLTPIFSLNIIEAVLRFSLDAKFSKKDVFSVGIRKYLTACVFCFLFVFINYQFKLIDSFNEFPIYFLLYFVSNLFSDLMFQFARGLERLVDVAVAGILSSVTVLTMNILMLVVLKKGLAGYFIANISAFLISSIYLFIRTKAWRYIELKIEKRNVSKEMTHYSAPMVLNSICWWINNASDKYVVTFMCGAAANGILSVAYKIPSVLTLFQTIFNQAWTISAVKEFDENSGKFYTNIYSMYNSAIVIVCSVLIIFNKVIAKTLFASDFYLAWKYSPFLMVSVMFNSLSALLGGVFTAAKKSKIHGKTTVVGAAVNIVLNIALVYFIGPVGAAIATMISNIVVWLCRIVETNKIIKLSLNMKQHILSYIILVLQTVIMLLVDNIFVMTATELCCLIFILIIYNKDLRKYLNVFILKLKSLRSRENK